MGGTIDEEIIELKGRAPQAAFLDLANERAHERGYAGYTGTLAEKRGRGFRLIGQCQDGTVEDLELLARIVEDDRWTDADLPDFDPRTPAKSVSCRQCYGVGETWIDTREESPDGKVRRLISEYVTCPGCAGTGTHTLTNDEAVAEAERTERRADVMRRFGIGLRQMRDAALAFDDKWGPAVGFATGTHLWVGGWCSD